MTTGDERVAEILGAAEERVRRLETSPQYLLGDALLRAVRSWRGLRRLPSRLWRLRAVVRHRRPSDRRLGDRPVLPVRLLGPRELVGRWAGDDDGPLVVIDDGSATIPSDAAFVVPATTDTARLPMVSFRDVDPVRHRRPHRVVELGDARGDRTGSWSDVLVAVVDRGAPATDGPDRAEALCAGVPVMVRDEPLDGEVCVGPGERRQAVRRLRRSPGEVARIGRLGRRRARREVALEATVSTVASRLGLVDPFADALISVVCVTNRPGQLEHVIASFERQVAPQRELIVVAHGGGFEGSEVDEAVEQVAGRLLRVPFGVTLAECLELGREHASGRFLAKFDDDDWYGPHYLADAVLDLDQTGAAVVGKASYLCHAEAHDMTYLRTPGREMCWSSRLCGATLVLDLQQTAGVRFPPVARAEDSLFLDRCLEAGLGILSGDRFEFVQVRRADHGTHTWQLPLDEYLADAVPVSSGLALEAAFV